MSVIPKTSRKQKTEMEEVLQQCKQSAAEGYKIATSHYAHLHHTLSDAKTKVRNTLLEFKTSSANVDETADKLDQELSQIDEAFEDLVSTFKVDVENKRENLSRFSVTLFGRTMAGKSTLMAILTDGNDEAIGQGAQRTTRDIRAYDWKGLHITDVPGIGAFDGAEDETIAFEAAKSGDIILFLITDDGPQAAEADFLARVISIGKPVILLMNVKEGISEERTPERNLKKIERKFDPERLAEIKNQFLSYAAISGQNWDDLPFIYVHLQAARKAQKENDQLIAKDYYRVSRFGDLEKLILKIVKQKGSFYRKKSFIDTITVPMVDTMESLLGQSRTNSVQARILNDKIDQIRKWEEKFRRNGKSRIVSLETSVEARLHLEIPAFAEAHFADRKADKAWNEIIDSYHINERCRELMDNLDSICIDRIQETARQIENELRYYSKISSDKSLRMKPIVDSKRITEWSTTIIGGVAITLSVLSAIGIMTVSVPFSIISAGIGLVSIGSRFMKSRNKKEGEARKELEGKLHVHVEKIIASIHKDMDRSFQNIISDRLERLIIELERMKDLIFQLANVQRNLAWELNKHILEANESYITEGLRYIGADGMQYHIYEIGRIPGSAVVIVLEIGRVFPLQELRALKKLLPENVSVIKRVDNKEEMIRKLAGKGIKKESVIIELENGIAHLPGVNDDSEITVGARLAQQLTQIQITK